MDVLQTSGTLGAQNLLGLISHLIVFPFFALVLAGSGGWFAILTVLSRQGHRRSFHHLTRHNWAGRVVVCLGLTLIHISAVDLAEDARRTLRPYDRLALLVPLVLVSFQQRERINGQASSDYERTAYENAALMMFSDNPLGVGANHFTLVANTQGYFLRAGVPQDFYSLAGQVHNVYYLIAAETGYPGLAAFLFMLACPLFVAFRCERRYRRDQRGDLLLGLGVGLLAVYIHSFFEWSLVTFQAQYLIAFSFGSVAGIAQQLGYWQKISTAEFFYAVGS